MNARVVLESSETPIFGVSTDTRQLTPGAAFFALRGERFDAHNYLNVAVDRGASVLILDRENAIDDTLRAACTERSVGVLLVNDTTEALARLARDYRASLQGRVIAVTGSNGKTTTVRMIDAVLSTRDKGSASQKSFNNHIGVPLTVLSASEEDDYLVAEVGMNAPGEVAPLAEILEPDIVVITNIGHAHIEAFDDQRGIAKEKAVLLGSLRADGIAFLNTENSHLDAFIPDDIHHEVFGLHDRARYRLRTVDASSELSTTFSFSDDCMWSIPVPGQHNALNALAAVMVGRCFKLSDGTIQAGLSSFKVPGMRLEPIESEGIRFINDAYNASPESVSAAIATFSSFAAKESGRRVIVLGDMLEQGDHAPIAHLEALRRATETSPDLLITFGEHYARLHRSDDAFEHADDASLRQAAGRLRTGDLVLLKGSRGLGLERLLDIVRSMRVDTS